MKKFQNKYRIETTRSKNWDYSLPAWYYVTICTDERRHFFGDIDQLEPRVRLIILGRTAFEFFKNIPDHFPFVKVEAFVIMPNHVHGLLKFQRQENIEERLNSFGPQSKNLASVIRGFKGAVQTFATMNRMPFKWQASYHCTITKSQRRADIIINYIKSNPAKWIEKMKRYQELKARVDNALPRDV